MEDSHEHPPLVEDTAASGTVLRLVVRQMDGDNPSWLIDALTEAVRVSFLPPGPTGTETHVESDTEPAAAASAAEMRAIGRIDQISASNPDRTRLRQENPPTPDAQRQEENTTQGQLETLLGELRGKGYHIQITPKPTDP